MAAEMNSSPVFRDMLDIVFADRNRAYGAYLIRRDYPKHLRNALVYGLLLITATFVVPIVLSALKAMDPIEPPTEVKAILGPPPDIDKNTPPPTPPPVETPPPPTRSTNRLVPPDVLRDELVQDEKQMSNELLLASDADIGKETKTGNTEAPPAVLDNPVELRVIEEPTKPAAEETFELFDIQKPPSFPGGDNELMLYLAKNIKYPALANENRIQGAVHLSFVVNKDGTVSDVTIVRDIGGGCGKEAVRVVSNMPRWSPGEANGHPVKVRFRIPVRFKLE